MGAASGLEMMLRAVIGKEAMEEVQRFATGGSLQKVVTAFDTLDEMRATLKRLEERLDGDGYSNVPCPRCGFCTCGPGPSERLLIERRAD